VDHDGSLALISAAERGGVKKFVYVSYSGNVQVESPLSVAKRDSEAQLLKGPMQAVILRPSYFMEMWLSPALGFDCIQGSARLYGSGDAKVNYISAFDVADFAVVTATKDFRDKNTVLEMGGPDALSQLDAVGIFEQALGRKITVNSLPVEAIEQQYGSPDPLQKTFAALMLAYAKGDVIPGSQAVAREYDITLRSVAQYAAGIAAQGAANVA
jgi:NADH dehydrogenase